MSLEVLTFKNELEKIDEAHNKLVTSVDNFILSNEAFNKNDEFENKLSEIQKNVTVLAELKVASPEQAEFINKFAESNQPEGEREAKQKTLMEYFASETTFTFPKALVAVATVLACAVTVSNGLLPPITFIAVVSAVLAFAFAPQLKQLIQAFLEKKLEAEEEMLTLEDIEKISGLFSQIRRKYVAAYFLIRWQGSPDEPVPEVFEGLGLPKELVNRGEYLRRTLPHEFMDVIGRIVNACERSIWQRKQLIVSAMVQSSMASLVRR